MASSSPYASSFKTAIANGTPCSKAVENIASRKGTTPSVVFNSLYRADLVYRQKFNGKWIYWPAESKKSTATQRKVSQFECWQSFIDWVIASGFTTPDKLWQYSGSQTDFMKFCRKFFAKQFSTGTTKRRSTRKSTRRRTTNRRRPTTTSRRRTSSTRRRTSTTSRRRPSTSARRRSTSTSARRRSTTGTRRRTSTTARKRSTSRSYSFPRSSSSTTRRYRRAA